MRGAARSENMNVPPEPEEDWAGWHGSEVERAIF